MNKFSLICQARTGRRAPKFSSPKCIDSFLSHSVVLYFCGALLLLSACSGPQLHSNLTADPHVLLRKWVYSTHGDFDMGDHGVEFSSPLAVGNTLVFGNQSTGLVALYPGFLNQRKWQFPVKGGVLSDLAIDNGVVYFGGGDGFLYAVNLETGLLQWKYEVRNPIISRPTVFGGRLFITTSDDVVYAFDAGTGKWLWHYRRHTSAPVSILGASAPLVDGGDVITGLSDGFLVALSMEEGRLKWERRLHFGTKFTDVNAHPILENGIIYIPSYDGALYALKRQNGEVLWRYDAGGSKDVHLENQKIYLPSSDGNIYCLDQTNAKVIWKFELDRGIPTRLAVTDQYIIVGSSFQYLYVLEKSTGQAIYRFNAGFGNGFSGAPFYDAAAQRIYILSSAGNMYAFALRKPLHKVRPHGATDPYEF